MDADRLSRRPQAGGAGNPIEADEDSGIMSGQAQAGPWDCGHDIRFQRCTIPPEARRSYGAAEAIRTIAGRRRFS
jgi:hypothetical protein